MDGFLDALRAQVVLVLSIAALQFMAVGLHAPVVLNVQASTSKQPVNRLCRWAVRSVQAGLIATSTVFHLFLIWSTGMLIARVDKATGLMTGLYGVVAFVAVFVITFREGRRAFSELKWTMDKGLLWTGYISAARRQVYALLVRIGLGLMIVSPLVGMVAATDAGEVSRLLAYFAAMILMCLAAVPVAIAHPRHFGLTDFMAAVGPLFRERSESDSPGGRRFTRLRDAWELAWIPSDFTLKARAAATVPDHARVRRAVRPLRFAILRQYAALQPPSRRAFLSAADTLLAEFAEAVVKPDDIKGNPAIRRAVQLVVADDLSVLEPTWATPPSIMDNRAWAPGARPRAWRLSSRSSPW
ncbi:hypothetical protein OHA18_25860 [Kribbella sp. NBC_00709]|uniref:hypothetical protein n=1 Tax=Kribbella sp. NBC_00709 TaxID=2975972 RepID=UPI002E2D4CF6|nr:hypothetical protein [Kribbella sp. NBC_00709]